MVTGRSATRKTLDRNIVAHPAASPAARHLRVDRTLVCSYVSRARVDPRSLISRLSPLLWLGVYLAIAGTLQAAIPVPWDEDTAYHAAVGRLIHAHGVLRAFPWTPFSWLADHYADKELAFHLLFAAFGNQDWITTARVVGTVTGATLLYALYLVLRAERVPYAGLWALGPLAASSVFVFRFVLVRPLVISIALAIVVLWAAVRDRVVILALAAAVYPWMYVAWPLLIGLVIIAESAKRLSGLPIGWKTLAAVVLGMSAGVALHPNAVNLVRVVRIEIGEVLFSKAWGRATGIELGDELGPFLPIEWVRYLLGTVSAAALAAAITWRRRAEPATTAFTVAALAFGVLTVRSARFAEYFVPFTMAALALASRQVASRHLPAVTLGGMLLYSLPATVALLGALRSRPNWLPPPAAARLAAGIPSGAQVFTCEWGFTGTMMLALPDRKFVVGLNPVYFYVKDPALYAAWFAIPREPPADVADVIRRKFGARYVLCRRDERFRRFFDQIGSEPRVTAIPTSPAWAAFDLGA